MKEQKVTQGQSATLDWEKDIVTFSRKNKDDVVISLDEAKRWYSMLGFILTIAIEKKRKFHNALGEEVVFNKDVMIEELKDILKGLQS